jgi:hypothetical protein
VVGWVISLLAKASPVSALCAHKSKLQSIRLQRNPGKLQRK